MQDSAIQLEELPEIKCKHLPSLSVYPMIGEVFFLSGLENSFPISMRYINEDNMQIQSDLLPQIWKEQMILIASSLTNFLSALGIPQGKAEYWSLGSSANFLAQIACNKAQEIRPMSSSPNTSAAVIIIDRVRKNKKNIFFENFL